MIRKFKEIKEQLKELAPVINSFKSESVQLRIVELIFRGESSEELEEEGSIDENSKVKRPKKKTPKKPSKKKVSQIKKVKALKSKKGPVGVLTDLINEDYFKTPHTLSDIVRHCSTHKAIQIKQSNLSSPLVRFVREKRLKRKKNSEGQYEYLKK